MTSESLVAIIKKNFNMRPGVIVQELDLAKPIYFQTAKNGKLAKFNGILPQDADRGQLGHFTNQDFAWEKPKPLIL